MAKELEKKKKELKKELLRLQTKRNEYTRKTKELCEFSHELDRIAKHVHNLIEEVDMLERLNNYDYYKEGRRTIDKE